MGLRFIREPSDTPNVQIGDDVRAFRYAYGDQNGYIKGKGTECGYEVNGLNFIIKSGEIVINGYASEVDANGVTLTIDNIVTKRYYSVYYQVNLALFSVSILATYDTAGYPVINPGDDLNVNTVGTARMELYRFTANNGVIADVAKIVTSIRYGNDAAILTKGLIADARIPSNIARINGTYNAMTVGKAKYAITQNSSDNSIYIATTAFVKTAISNFYGSGSLSVSPSLLASTNTIKRQGNLIYIRYIANSIEWTTHNFTIPQYCSAGNTSLLIRPTTTSLAAYRTRWSGKDEWANFGIVNISTSGTFSIYCGGSQNRLEILACYERA